MSKPDITILNAEVMDFMSNQCLEFMRDNPCTESKLDEMRTMLHGHIRDALSDNAPDEAIMFVELAVQRQVGIAILERLEHESGH